MGVQVLRGSHPLLLLLLLLLANSWCSSTRRRETALQVLSSRAVWMQQQQPAVLPQHQPQVVWRPWQQQRRLGPCARCRRRKRKQGPAAVMASV
jgi:hypothetical protein